MLSFIFVMVCGLFEWKRINAGDQNWWNIIKKNIDTSFHQRSLISVFQIWFNVYLLTSYMTRFGLWIFMSKKYPWLLAMVKIPLIGFNPPHFCACPKPGPGFSTFYVGVLFMLNEFRWLFVLLSVEKMVDHHRLNFLFISQYQTI